MVLERGNCMQSQFKREQPMISQNTDDPTTKLWNAIILTHQSALVLQQQTQRLPSLLGQLVIVSGCGRARQIALRNVIDWLVKILQKLEKTAWQKIYSQQSITDSAE